MKATVLALALAFSGVAFAADTSTATPPNAAAREAEHMTNLATEHEKMKAAFEQAKASGTKPDFAQMKALHQQIQTETLQKLQPVLSALQLKKFQVLSQMHGHGHFHHGPPGERSPAAPATAAPSSG